MTSIIRQRVKFSAPPDVLFDLYMDSEKHAAATDAPAKLSSKPGGAWKAHGGAIGGLNLMLIPGRMIAQSWRATHWHDEDVSILILTFAKVKGGTILDLVHVGVPQYDQKGVRYGWPNYYWKPWKKYLASGKKSRGRKS